MLGLMASGLQGQRFAFHGYAPVKAHERDAQLRAWESASRKQQQTQILIETPYRNAALFEALLRALRGATRLCVASALTCTDEAIAARAVARWRKPAPRISSASRPCFCIWQANGGGGGKTRTASSPGHPGVQPVRARIHACMSGTEAASAVGRADTSRAGACAP